MAVTVRSFAKINIGLNIGPLRSDRFHQLATLYQTVALHDVIRVSAGKGSGIRIQCSHPGVPTDETNTCWRIAELTLQRLKVSKSVRIEIDKRLPVQGGMGAASSNAVATMLALEKALKRRLEPEDRLQIAAEVGSDLPLFMIGGTVLGNGRGEEVFGLEDLPVIPCVVVTPPIGVSTPAAFAAWDKAQSGGAQLTASSPSDKMKLFSRTVYRWLNGSSFSPTGVPGKGRDRAEALLLDIVRTGIENDFERVVFPLYPALRDVKSSLVRAGARYASLSGSGSTVYGLFATRHAASRAASSLIEIGLPARATVTLPRKNYWRRLFQS